MSVFIKGLDKPRSCDMCYLAKWNPFDDSIQCAVTKELISAYSGLYIACPNSCPIVESDLKAKWIRIRGVCTPGGDPYYECTHCGNGRCYGVEHPKPLEKECPYCGAKMTEIDDE